MLGENREVLYFRNDDVMYHITIFFWYLSLTYIFKFIIKIKQRCQLRNEETEKRGISLKSI